MSSSTASTDPPSRETSPHRQRRSASWSSSAKSFLKGQAHKEQTSPGDSSAHPYNATSDSSDRGFRLLPKRLRQKSSTNDDGSTDVENGVDAGGQRGVKWKKAKNSTQTKDLLFNNIFHRLNTSRSRRAQRQPKANIPIIRVTSPGASISPLELPTEFMDPYRIPRDIARRRRETNPENTPNTSREHGASSRTDMVDRKAQDDNEIEQTRPCPSQDDQSQSSQPTTSQWWQQSNPWNITDSGNKPEHNDEISGEIGEGTGYPRSSSTHPSRPQPLVFGDSGPSFTHKRQSPPSEMTPRQAMEFQLAMDRWQGREIGAHGGMPRGVFAPEKLMSGAMASGPVYAAGNFSQRCPSSNMDPNKICSLLQTEETPVTELKSVNVAKRNAPSNTSEDSSSGPTIEAGRPTKEQFDGDGDVVADAPSLLTPRFGNLNTFEGTAPPIGFFEFLRAACSFTRSFILDRRTAQFAILSTRYCLQLIANTMSFCLLFCNFAFVFLRGGSLRDALNFIAATDGDYTTDDRTGKKDLTETTIGMRMLRVVVLLVLVGALALAVRTVRNTFALLDLTLRVLVAAKDILGGWMERSGLWEVF